MSFQSSTTSIPLGPVIFLIEVETQSSPIRRKELVGTSSNRVLEPPRMFMGEKSLDGGTFATLAMNFLPTPDPTLGHGQIIPLINPSVYPCLAPSPCLHALVEAFLRSSGFQTQPLLIDRVD